MSNHPEIGVMIHTLGGRTQKHVDEIKNALNHKILSIEIKDDDLIIKLDGYPTIKMFDAGQSCCESRYMTCDDTLSEYEGANLLDIKIESADSTSDEIGDEHEIEFLKLVTDRGIITISNHNVHNGYYGGFSIDWKLV